jgi:hypothetical protein
MNPNQTYIESTNLIGERGEQNERRNIPKTTTRFPRATYVLNPSQIGCGRLAKKNVGKLEV